MKKVIVYADVNLNLVDGSAIWLRSLAEVISKTGAFEAHIILKQKVPEKDLKELPFIKWIDPFNKDFSFSLGGKKLNNREALDFISYYQRDFFKADFFIIRQVDWKELSNWDECLLNKSFIYNISGLGKMLKLNGDVLNRCGGVIAQTELQLDFMKKASKDASFSSFIMPPMIPSIVKGVRNRNKLVYCGKFTLMWQVEEMIEAFSDLVKINPNLEFHIAGDKFDSTLNKESLISLMDRTKGVYWHKRLSRDESINLISNSGVGLGYRSPELNDPMEISTKLLEYCMAGLPVITNPGTIHNNLFGSDYPLFVNSIDEFKKAVLMVTGNSVMYEDLSTLSEKVSMYFSYEESSERFYNFFSSF